MQYPELRVGDWKVLDFDHSQDRVVVQIEFQGSQWLDLIVDDFADGGSTITEWGSQLFRYPVGEMTSSLSISEEWSLSAKEKIDVFAIGRTMFLVSEGWRTMDIYVGEANGRRGPSTAFSPGNCMAARFQDLIMECVQVAPLDRPSLKHLLQKLQAEHK
ncbi:hypothetical protein ANO11243_042020 [Dothideomycetidae sp. 11243]|nr:hypothetical protein ANO11243_042020 [fungal sp. No.11243]